jgi:hypothetical protein
MELWSEAHFGMGSSRLAIGRAADFRASRSVRAFSRAAGVGPRSPGAGLPPRNTLIRGVKRVALLRGFNSRARRLCPPSNDSRAEGE